MSITLEECKKIESLGLKKHVQLVDGYISTGLDIDDITIHYAVDQEQILMVLHAYGFTAGPEYGDETDSKRKYKKLPFHYVEAYVSAHFPGIVTDDTTIEEFLDSYDPNWLSGTFRTKSSLFGLSEEELQGADYFNSLAKKRKRNDNHVFSRLLNALIKTNKK